MTNELLSIKRVSFAYGDVEKPALSDICFSIMKGELVGIAGSAGAGKSTLIRCASGIVPQFFKGRFSGQVKVNGEPISGRRVSEMAGTVGTVFQDFESQLFSTNVRRELAFGMENLCLNRDIMHRRINRIAQLLGLSDFMEREPQSLSGGQKQRLALASILCLDPKLLLCDEPTTDLDPFAKNLLLDVLAALVSSGNSVGLVTHDIERLIKTDRVIVMNDGSIVASGKATQVFSDPQFCTDNGLFAPQIFSLFSLLGLPDRPVSIQNAKEVLDGEGYVLKKDIIFDETARSSGIPLITVENVCHCYTPDLPVLEGISFEIRQGEFVCLLGRNGSGKTTLVKTFNAFLRPTSGQVFFKGIPVEKIGPSKMGKKIGFVFQNPDQMLFAENVFEETVFGLRNYGISEEEIPQRVSEALKTVGLKGTEDIDPFVMTKGDRQKLAVACVLACEPEVIILDEPTTGLDAKEQISMMELLAELNREGHTLVIITHSARIAAEYAHRIVILDSGKIVGDGSTREILSKPDLLSRSSLIAPPCVRLGHMYGISVINVFELARAIEKEVP